MIQHLLKMIGKQWRQNVWIAAELFLVFFLLAYIMDYFITIGYISSIPYACDIKDTYQIRLVTLSEGSPQYVPYEEDSRQAAENFLTLVERIRRHPAVEEVSLSNMSAPYNAGYMNVPIGRDTASTHYAQLLEVTPSFFEVFRMCPESGGKPSVLKEALTEKNFVISRKMKEVYFPGEKAEGELLYYMDDDPVEYRVGGVCGVLKRDDYSREEMAFYRLLSNTAIAQMKEKALTSLEISVRVKPGVNGEEFKRTFMQEMHEQLRVGNFLLYKVLSYEEMRNALYLVNGVTDNIRYRIAFMVFLIINIFLGIIGTFWFRNEYRKPEIGLRLALGSTRKQVLHMMIGEGWLLLTLVAIPAIIICVNLAKMEFVSTNIMDITFLRIFFCLSLTYLFMALIILLAAWYPAYLSSRIAPADTLRSE